MNLTARDCSNACSAAMAFLHFRLISQHCSRNVSSLTTYAVAQEAYYAPYGDSLRLSKRSVWLRPSDDPLQALIMQAIVSNSQPLYKGSSLTNHMTCLIRQFGMTGCVRHSGFLPHTGSSRGIQASLEEGIFEDLRWTSWNLGEYGCYWCRLFTRFEPGKCAIGRLTGPVNKLELESRMLAGARPLRDLCLL